MNKKLTIDNLFDKLQVTTDQSKIKNIEANILSLWLETGNHLIDDLMEDGMRFMGEHQYGEAINTFSKVIRVDSEYAEGWNKRAIVYYLRGEFKLALDDIKRTLELEPRHFAALSGLANIYREVMAYKKALGILKRMSIISPNRETLDEQIKAIEQKL